MRVLLLVLDSVGIGALPDARLYGDVGANTLANTAREAEGISLPNLSRLGLGNIIPAQGVAPVRAPQGHFGRMAEAAPGKDTITGHWEMAGVVIEQPFRTYPGGFPEELIAELARRIGRGIIGNYAASGTEIIEELGAEHMASGKPIVYTSADSVCQIAAHEEVISLDELYSICAEARELFLGAHSVARIIARPFTGTVAAFQRTANRRDFALAPPVPTVLDKLTAEAKTVLGVGKIKDIFAGRGVSENFKTRDNAEGIDVFVRLVNEGRGDLVFANLVDFDMVYGHRNNALGYAGALEAADAGIGRAMAAMRASDVLIISADHGCDPTFPGTDHTREYVPLLAWGPGLAPGQDLGIRTSFADVAATIADLLGVDWSGVGTSFAGELRGDADK